MSELLALFYIALWVYGGGWLGLLLGALSAPLWYWLFRFIEAIMGWRSL